MCADCVEDLFLQDLIADNLASPQCSYCDRGDTTDIAAPAEVIIEAIAGAVHHLYADPTSAAGRMNPAGISYFYCALQSGTAIAETVPSPPVTAAVATFETTREISVLNLCELPPLPSLFDSAKRTEYEWLMFLHGFVAEISEPVRKDGREHIDYVPSQVVSEWFAQVFRPKGRKSRLDGLLYPSAVARGGKNLVLFPTSRSYERTFESVSYVCATVLDLPDWKSMTDAFSGPAQ